MDSEEVSLSVTTEVPGAEADAVDVADIVGEGVVLACVEVPGAGVKLAGAGVLAVPVTGAEETVNGPFESVSTVQVAG